jgi:hypothetical protein
MKRFLCRGSLAVIGAVLCCGSLSGSLTGMKRLLCRGSLVEVIAINSSVTPLPKRYRPFEVAPAPKQESALPWPSKAERDMQTFLGIKLNSSTILKWRKWQYPAHCLFYICDSSILILEATKRKQNRSSNWVRT